MLENIKLILGLEKNDYDNLIIFYIDKVTKRVKGYCNIEDLDELEEMDQDAINEFIEDKVANIMAYKLSSLGENVDDSGTSTPANQGAIKSITRGSVSITYASTNPTVDTTIKTSSELSNDEKGYLNQFRRLRF